jgi:type I restriction enzyme M protein
VLEKAAELNKKIKEAQIVLNKKVLNKYSKLTEGEIKFLVVDDKWITKISTDVKSEMDRISQRLTQRIKELDERYERPLHFLTTEVACSESKLKGHLKTMGFEWS